MKLITTNVYYNVDKHTNPLVQELGALLKIPKTVDEDGKEYYNIGYTDITLTDTEYFKYYSILDRPSLIREA